MADQYQHILDQMPYEPPFLFVDKFTQIDENGCKGQFTFRKELDFYQGHFPNNPVTPGVILTEVAAQIGLVGLGIYLIDKNGEDKKLLMTSCDMQYTKAVYPGQTVHVESEKLYFRMNKLKAKVIVKNEQGQVVCRGEIAGMMVPR
jgi:3-hydroxyacyl-[acyl-carrier-protein] dehydratase